MAHNSENQPQPIAIWLESANLSRRNAAPSGAEARALESKDEAILALLAKLALHYWRPDFTPSQAKQLYGDYLDDLRDYPLSEVAKAIAKYRQDGRTFYPQSGQLVQIIRTIPSWDVRTEREHIAILRAESARELAAVTAKIEAQNRPAITGPTARTREGIAR